MTLTKTSMHARPTAKRTLTGHSRKIQAMAWHKDSKSLIVADQGGNLVLWDAKMKLRKKFVLAPFMLAATLHPEKNLAVVGGMENIINVYDINPELGTDCKLVKQLEGHDGYISSLLYMDNAAKANTLLSSGGDGSIIAWDEDTWQKKAEFIGHTDGCGSLCKPMNGCDDVNMFATASSDQTVRIWDLRSGQSSYTLHVPAGSNRCCFYPTGTAIAAGCTNGTVYVYDLRSQTPFCTHERNKSSVSSMDVSKSGRAIYVGYDDGIVCGWDSFFASDPSAHAFKLDAHQTSGTSHSGTVHQRKVAHLSFAPDGSCFATGGFDSLIKIWGPTTK